MKITKHLSLISIVLVGVLVIKKMSYDIEYKIEILDNTDSIAAGSMIIPMYYFALILISLIASIIGYTQKNKYRKLGLILNITSIVYLLIPINLIMLNI